MYQYCFPKRQTIVLKYLILTKLFLLLYTLFGNFSYCYFWVWLSSVKIWLFMQHIPDVISSIKTLFPIISFVYIDKIY